MTYNNQIANRTPLARQVCDLVVRTSSPGEITEASWEAVLQGTAEGLTKTDRQTIEEAAKALHLKPFSFDREDIRTYICAADRGRTRYAPLGGLQVAIDHTRDVAGDGPSTDLDLT